MTVGGRSRRSQEPGIWKDKDQGRSEPGLGNRAAGAMPRGAMARAG